ncbi:acyltransferase family protein [Galactobacter caseinivorans]|uniref:Acyltransferase n=1 Tax=Galactobacter caseinivorans TaxID=2676123 RepID=A0A496PJN0_9MICC|nr:acyltransferase [Galactobacter caseinivorans]RKW70686.1 acyltransferase [Galactobacter caseinivorans]
MRDTSIDVGRGLAIVAIVLGHVIRGLGSAGLLDTASAEYILWDRAIYLFHLAVFALLGGLFIAGSVSRKGVPAYLRERLVNFFYVYLLWTLLQEVLVRSLSNTVVNTPLPWYEALALWKPQAQFWYLPFLIVTTLILCLLRPWASTARAVITAALFVAIALLRWGIPGDFFGEQGLGLLLFLAAGTLLGAKRFTALLSRLSYGRRWLMTAGCLAASAAMFAFTPTMPSTTAGGLERTPFAVACGLVASVLAVAAVLLLSSALTSWGWLARPLAYLGRHSMEIFLAHILGASGARIVLNKLGIEAAGPHLILGVLAGLAFPLVLIWLTPRLHLGLLWAPPRAWSGARKPASATVSEAATVSAPAAAPAPAVPAPAAPKPETAPAPETGPAPSTGGPAPAGRSAGPRHRADGPTFPGR